MVTTWRMVMRCCTAILTKGEIFGELAMAGEEKRRDFAQAMEETTICPLTTEELKDLMYENKELSFKILKLIGLAYHETGAQTGVTGF